MSRIRVGQVWSRKPDDKIAYFPRLGWKVRVWSYLDGLVVSVLIEFNGKERVSQVDPVTHDEETFLELYEYEREK
jgi:hypothetical protein